MWHRHLPQGAYMGVDDQTPHLGSNVQTRNQRVNHARYIFPIPYLIISSSRCCRRVASSRLARSHTPSTGIFTNLLLHVTLLWNCGWIVNVDFYFFISFSVARSKICKWPKWRQNMARFRFYKWPTKWPAFCPLFCPKMVQFGAKNCLGNVLRHKKNQYPY